MGRISEGAIVDGYVEAGAGAEAGEVAGADSSADFLEDGAVFDDGDADLEVGGVVIGMLGAAS